MLLKPGENRIGSESEKQVSTNFLKRTVGWNKKLGKGPFQEPLSQGDWT